MTMANLRVLTDRELVTEAERSDDPLVRELAYRLARAGHVRHPLAREEVAPANSCGHAPAGSARHGTLVP